MRVAGSCITRITAEADPASYGKLHVDERSDARYHLSAVLHLQSQGSGFEGGELVFSDNEPGAVHDERSLTPLPPVQGRLLVFSSGWENEHYVSRVTNGVRFALPVFFELQRDGEDYDRWLAESVCELWSA